MAEAPRPAGEAQAIQQAIQQARGGQLLPAQVSAERVNALGQVIFDNEEVWHEMANHMGIALLQGVAAEHRWRASVKAFYRDANNAALAVLGQNVPRNEDVFLQYNEIRNFLRGLAPQELRQHLGNFVQRALHNNQPRFIRMLLDAGEQIANPLKEIVRERFFNGLNIPNDDEIRFFLDGGIPVDIQYEQPGDNEGVTLLMGAAVFGRLETLRMLLDRHAPVNQQRPNGETALLFAVRENQRACALELMNRGANVNQEADGGGTPFMMAAARGSSDLIVPLIEHGADVAVVDDEGNTPLMWASGGNRPGLVLPLLLAREDFRATIHNRNGHGQTALIKAASLNRVDGINLLIASGARVDDVDDDGKTALMYTTGFFQSDDACEALLVHHADINKRDNGGQTALMMAARAGAMPPLRSLLAHHADVNLQDNQGRTALMIAVQRKKIDVVRALLAHDATDVNLVNNQHQSALFLAEQNGFNDIAALLRARGAR